MRRRDVATLLLAVCLLLAAGKGARAEGPSGIEQDGASLVWTIGGSRIWRFPLEAAPFVQEMSDRFNRCFIEGFPLDRLRTDEENGSWSLCVGKCRLVEVRPEFAGPIPMKPRLLSLLWLSRIYDALGRIHSPSLSSRYHLRGGFRAEGSVSWYGGSSMVGARFANGERYDEEMLIAAAQSLPFGTLVRIREPSTGKSVVVRIVDRFREHRGRLLDISKAAAEVLGIKSRGVARVVVEVIGRIPLIGGTP
jgi:rare lipoprotein A